MTTILIKSPFRGAMLGLGMALACLQLGAAASAPAPHGAIPTKQQVEWQRLEYYAFVHFGLNTWTAKEWGYGDEDPTLFNPNAFDADAIVKLFKAAGMRGVMFTAKHHDGFCMWPTKTTPHNISKSPWHRGKGDVVKEFSLACKKNEMLFGTYLSPWDRNHPEYAQPGYLKAYYGQITELLTNYGPVFEIWFDGANGGDGFYGGARETRKMPENYYQFEQLVKMIRKLQPKTIIWGADRHGDARWGGSEKGHVGYPHWATMGKNGGGNGATGTAHGGLWIPAEGDTSIRHGWFWHAKFNHTVKSPEELLQVWLDCVGRGANLILNVPPDRSGRIFPADAEALMGLKALLDQLQSQDHALKATTQASNVRGNSKNFDCANLIDNNIETYWTTDDGNHTPSVEITLPQPRTFDLVRVREQIRLGQRVESFTIEAWVDDAWQQIIDGKTIGNQVILPTHGEKGRPVTTAKLRLKITGCPAVPCISEFSLLTRPIVIPKPVVTRKGDDAQIQMTEGFTIRYTLNGTQPTPDSPAYTAPIPLPDGGIINACAYDAQGKSGPSTTASLPISKVNWQVISTTSKGGNAPTAAIDDDPKTFWHTHAYPPEGEQAPPQSFTVDMGRAHHISAFSYLPRQDGTTNGMTDRYTFEVSPDNKQWAKVAEGEFSNLAASPIECIVNMPAKLTTPVRYFRFTATRAIKKKHVSAAEISIYLQPLK